MRGDADVAASRAHRTHPEEAVPTEALPPFLPGDLIVGHARVETDHLVVEARTHGVSRPAPGASAPPGAFTAATIAGSATFPDRAARPKRVCICVCAASAATRPAARVRPSPSASARSRRRGCAGPRG